MTIKKEWYSNKWSYKRTVFNKSEPKIVGLENENSCPSARINQLEYNSNKRCLLKFWKC